MIRQLIVLVALLGTAVSGIAEEGLTAWQKTKLVAIYPTSLHQLPLTTIHEGSHALTSAMFGGKPTIHLLPGYTDFEGKKVLTSAHVDHSAPMSGAEEAIVCVVPYIVQLAVVDRLTEQAYRRGTIRIDSFGDKYVQNVLAFNMASPLENSFSRHSDFGQLSKRLHVHRLILGAVVQTAYVYSYLRIMKARGHQNSTWVLYIHRTF